MLTRLLVSRLLVKIAYIKMWVHLTFVLVHLRKKVSLEPWLRTSFGGDFLGQYFNNRRFSQYLDFFIVVIVNSCISNIVLS